MAKEFEMKKITTVLICLALIFSTLVFSTNTALADENKTATILFTHDMHAHFDQTKVKKGDTYVDLGGYGRLYTAIQAEKEKYPNALVLDGGDFSMGTLFQTIYASDAPDLKMLNTLGYDAITLGNHEFDFRLDGVKSSIEKAEASGEIPPIVGANYKIDDKVKDYTIIEKDGLKVGVFGLMGVEAASNAPMAGIDFLDPIKEAKRVVKILKEEEKVDLIVALSHSGIFPNPKDSEDEILAKEVSDIDVIISGHTHTKLGKPIQIGNTLIASAGEYSENLGSLTIEKQQSNNRWQLKDYSLVPIGISLEPNKEIEAQIASYKQMIEQKYLNNFNLTFDKVIAKSSFDFTDSSKVGIEHKEDGLANLISDAYMYAATKYDKENTDPVDVAIVPSGTIRGSFVNGEITVSDVFNVSSLGIGKDKLSGYPLISVYITGKELKAAAEVDASIAPMMSSAQLYMSGMSYTFNPNRLFLNKVTEASFMDKEGNKTKIDDNKLYRVVVGLYTGQMLSAVKAKSVGLLSITPKDKNGNPITDIEDHIIYTEVNGERRELKEWVALADYMQSLEEIPSFYETEQGRKIVDPSKSIGALVKAPNKIAFMLLGVVVLVILIIVAIVLFIKRPRKRRRF